MEQNRNNWIDELPFYLGYVKQQKDDTLELGCSTGRILLYLFSPNFDYSLNRQILLKFEIIDSRLMQ